MSSSRRRFCCVLLSLSLLCGVSLADEDCQTGNEDFCKCSTANLTLDLRKMGLPFPVSAKDAEGKYEYTYTPCDLAVCGDSGEAASVLCQVKIDTKVAFSVGRYEPFKWTITNYEPLWFEIQYGGGDKAGNKTRSSVVVFLAGPGTSQFTYESEGESLTYYFDVVGSGVGPERGGSSSGGIEGPIGLAIIFLTLGGFVAYLVIGGIFMYTQRGARGAEIIPNYSFWKDLPFLVKDGFFFTISPCYKGNYAYKKM